MTSNLRPFTATRNVKMVVKQRCVYSIFFRFEVKLNLSNMSSIENMQKEVTNIFFCSDCYGL